MAKINTQDLPLFIRTATRAELTKMMDIFTVAINDLDSRMGLKEGDTTEIHQTLSAFNATLGSLNALVGSMNSNVSGNLASIQALQAVNRQIYKLSDAQLEDLKAISLEALSTLYRRMGDITDISGNIIGGDDSLSAEYGEPIGIIQYVLEKASDLASVQAKTLANEAALEGKAEVNHEHDADYRPIDYVPDWAEITSLPTEFVPSAASPYYRGETWVPTWQDIVNKPLVFTPDIHDHDAAYEPKDEALQAHIAAPHAPVGAEVNVQSDWNQVDTGADDFVKNKPATYAPSAHEHDANYEAKNANIQAHIASAHAPSNAEANVNPDWNATSGDAEILNKPTFDWAKIYAESGSAQIPASYIPNKPATQTFEVANTTAMLALSNVNQGDYCVVTDPDPDVTYVALIDNPTVIGDWQEFAPGVESVDGRQGVVTLNDLYAPISGSVNYRSNSWVPGWAQITGKPTEFTPADGSAYYRQDDWVPTWNEVTSKPSLFPPADGSTFYRQDDWVPTWNEVTSKPTEFTPAAGSAYYRSNTWVPGWTSITGKPVEFVPSAGSGYYRGGTWVPGWNDVTGKPTEFPPSTGSSYYKAASYVPTWAELTGKPTFNWAKIYGDSGNTVIPANYLPSIAIVDTYTAATEVAQLALDVQKGDICVRTDIRKTYIFIGTNNDAMIDWQELQSPTDAVSSVDGQTGVVVLNALQDGDFTSEGLMKRKAASGSYDIIVDNSANWNAAYAWGDHAEETYLDDNDFTANGIMTRDAAGVYGILSNDSVSWNLAYNHSQADHAPITADKTSDNETSHDNVLVDEDFTQAGFMVTDGQGNYSVETETFLTTILEEQLTGYAAATEPFAILSTDNILEAFGKLQYRVNLNDAKTTYAGQVVTHESTYDHSNIGHSHPYLPNTTTTISAGQASAIVANTAKVGITTAQANAIVANTAKVGYNDEVSTHESTYDHSNINHAHPYLPDSTTTISVAQANAIVANTAKVTYAGQVATHESTWDHDAFLTSTMDQVLTGFAAETAEGNLDATDTLLAALHKLETRVAINDLKNTADGSAAVTAHELEYDHDAFITGVAWADITGKPSTFTPASGSAYYRSNTWVPSFAQVTSKPTTLAGYGITDGYGSANKPYATTSTTSVAEIVAAFHDLATIKIVQETDDGWQTDYRQVINAVSDDSDNVGEGFYYYEGRDYIPDGIKWQGGTTTTVAWTIVKMK